MKKEKILEFIFNNFKPAFIGFIIGGIFGILILSYIIKK
jgi:formate/nitrite transporter FocA (FNT family)